jgi:C4-type Zn-finger protein
MDKTPASQTEAVHCPFCDGTETKLFSPFGSQLSVSTYWCDHCHTAFEKLKRVRKQG